MIRRLAQNPFVLSLSKHNRRSRFPFREELKIRCWTALAVAALWLLGKTTRKQYVGAEELLAHWQCGKQVILAFWHGRILLMSFPYQTYRGQKACIMNSIHRDGEIITRVIKRFGVSAVRGSSTRGWMGGLKGLLEAYRQGYDLLVVPDGPRGPRYQAKPGVLQLARATGAAIFPVAYGAAWKTTINSWDRLLIPFPFSRVTYVIGRSITVADDASPEVMEEKRKELQETLLAITVQADASFKDKRGRGLGARGQQGAASRVGAKEVTPNAHREKTPTPDPRPLG